MQDHVGEMGSCKDLRNSDKAKHFQNSLFCGALPVSCSEWSDEGQTVHKVSGMCLYY